MGATGGIPGGGVGSVFLSHSHPTLTALALLGASFVARSLLLAITLGICSLLLTSSLRLWTVCRHGNTHCYSSPHQGAAESDEEKPEPVITDVSDPHSLLNVDLEKYEWAATYIVARRIEEGRLERRGWAGEVWRGGGRGGGEVG